LETKSLDLFGNTNLDFLGKIFSFFIKKEVLIFLEKSLDFWKKKFRFFGKSLRFSLEKRFRFFGQN